MKVRELITTLNELDPELDVLCYTEHPEVLSKKHMFRLFDICGVSESEGERCRGEDNIATLKFGKSKWSERFAIIDMMLP